MIHSAAFSVYVGGGLIRLAGRDLKQYWFFLTSFGLAVVGAIFALGYLLNGGREQVLALVGGVGLLAVAQIILLGLIFELHGRLRARQRILAVELNDTQDATRESFEAVFNQLARLARDEQMRAGQVSNGLADIKTTFNAFREALAGDVANEQVISQNTTVEAQPVAPHIEVQEAPKPVDVVVPNQIEKFANQIFYALEPVVDLPTKRTAHYRLHAEMEFGGEMLTGELFYRAAAVAGIRPLIDKSSIDEALGLLLRLRGRDPHLCVLVPLGAETLQNATTVSNILEAFAATPVANGLIVEMPHVVLVGLGEQGLESLAKMARAGMVFALSQASVAVLDLEAMKLLNVKLVGMNASSLAGEAPSQSLLGFAQMARLARVNIYVTDVANAAVVPHLAKFARLACGPCFADPRRVRRAVDVGDQPAELAA